MTKTDQNFTDEDLTAFLDGEAGTNLTTAIQAALENDDGLAARLGNLDVSLDDLRIAFAPENLGAPSLPDLPPMPANQNRPLRGLVAASVVAVAFGIGSVSGYLFPRAEPEQGWLAAVASYHALYVTDTLAGGHQDPNTTTAILDRFGKDHGIDLAKVTAVEPLDFRRTQLLGWNGNPLLQVAYLSPDGAPMAFCLTRVNKADSAPQTSVEFGIAVTHWVDQGIAYVILGGHDADLTAKLATQFQAIL